MDRTNSAGGERFTLELSESFSQNPLVPAKAGTQIQPQRFRGFHLDPGLRRERTEGAFCTCDAPSQRGSA